jgi:hypothetical protein
MHGKISKDRNHCSGGPLEDNLKVKDQKALYRERFKASRKRKAQTQTAEEEEEEARPRK